ncbi:FxSxx-COOH system tetratricopeptide repeat protein [Microbispora sp. NPDC004025]
MADMDDSRQPRSRDGQIVTFYSYKGGTGRTMALANVAWILASNGKRVLVADWDLDSPGLYRFYQPFIDISIASEPGIVDLIRSYEWAARRALPAEGKPADARAQLRRVIQEQARVRPYVFSLDWSFPDGGVLDYLPRGRQNLDYTRTVSAMDWDLFFDVLHGADFFDELRADMRRDYDYVLIDSRTGLSDVADICTMHLPDVLVDCFTLSNQGILGGAQVARTVQERMLSRDIRILPVPMRVDQAEMDKMEVGRAFAFHAFRGLPAGLNEAGRQEYWSAVEVPYQAFYAYEEILAVFGDPPGKPGSLRSAYERLTARLTDGAVTAMPYLDEAVRLRTRQRFIRKPPNEILLDYLPEDQAWAEWIGGVLTAAGLTVRDPLDEPDHDQWSESLASVLAVVTPAYIRRVRGTLSPRQPAYALYTASVRPVAPLSSATAAFLAGLPEDEAVAQLLEMVDMGAPPPARTLGARYPGAAPRIFEAPAKNKLFTGREDILRHIRDELRENGSAVMRPLTILGSGGMGKTQIAMEYAHRFAAAYDLVWWVDCEQPQFVDASLADLVARMRGPAAAGPALTSAEVVPAVRQALGQGEFARRWLLVFDNADDMEHVTRFLPGGSGHVLITSRNREWEQRSHAVQVDVFSREESVAHLLRRVGEARISMAEAGNAAEALGDLPLAVAAAGAWLAETEISVDAYLDQLRAQPLRAISRSRLAEYPESLSKAWDMSLQKLRDRSAAASRLFELCSVMAPRIGLDLLKSRAMVELLRPLDPTLAEPQDITILIRELDRLALIKNDTPAQRIHVHLMLQAVAQERMTEEEREAARLDVQGVLAAARPEKDVDDPANWPKYQMIWPHLEPVGAVYSGQEAVRTLLIDRLRYIWLRGDLPQAEEFGRRTAAVWEDMLAAETDPDAAARLERQLLHLRFNLGNVIRSLGRFGEARAMNESTLAEQRRVLGNHRHTLLTAGSLAADLRALGDYAGSLDIEEETYRTWRAIHGVEEPGTLASGNNLAVSYRVNGRFREALQLDEETLTQRRSVLGTAHPFTLFSAVNRGRDLLEAGDYDAAAARMAKTAAECAEHLGSGSPVSMNAQVVYAMALRATGAMESSEERFREAWTQLRRRFGDDSFDTLTCRLGRAVTLLGLDRADDAVREIEEVLGIYRSRLGEDHPHTLVCRLDLASALHQRGDQEKALTEVRAAADGFSARLGPDHPYHLAAKAAEAAMLADAGRLEHAADIQKDTLDRMSRSLGPRHPDTLRCQANLLLVRERLGAADAAAERETLLGQLAAVLGDDHPTVTTLRAGRLVGRTLDPQPF